MEEQLLHLYILDGIRVNVQRASENLANTLCSDLAKYHVATGWKSILSQLRLPTKCAVLHIGQTVLHIRDRSFTSPHHQNLHGIFQIVRLQPSLGCTQHIHERESHTTVNVRVASVYKQSS